MFVALVKLFVRLLATKGRMLVLGLLSVGMLLLSVTTGRSDDAVIESWRLLSLYGLGGLVPIASLVIGSSAFGDLVDDRTLVHLWLRPASRSQMVLAAWMATLILVVPFALVVPLASMFVAGMNASALTATAHSLVLGCAAYCGVFVAIGLRLKRALAWGLAYILVWEGAVANAGAGLAKLALRLSTRSIAHRGFSGAEIRFPLATSTATAVLVVVTVLSLALAMRWLDRAEVS
jgi:ABC-2 type transport system permease protein